MSESARLARGAETARIWDVAIVGAGPVGLGTALFLREFGLSAVVLESAAELPGDMRASTFHPPTLDLLERSGIAATLVAEGREAPRWQYLRLDTGAAVVFEVERLTDLTRHPFRLQCEQYRLTRAIAAHLAPDPDFALHFASTVVGFEQDAQGVRVRARRDRADAAEETVRARFLVGADGAKSFVRRMLEQELRGETYPRTSITVVVDFPFERFLPRMLHVNYVWTADDHYSLMRVRDGWRTGFSPAAGQSIEDAAADATIQGHLRRILPRAEPYRVVHVGAYTVHRRIVDAFRHGRVLLAGDAAHLNSPAGGMGMNSGIHDAHALAAALRAALRDGDDGALDDYARVRRAIAIEEVQRLSDRNYQRHRERDSTRREEVWRELEATAADPVRHREFLLESSMLASLERARRMMQHGRTLESAVAASIGTERVVP